MPYLAAASGAAKTISENGGFVATSTASIMISQVWMAHTITLQL